MKTNTTNKRMVNVTRKGELEFMTAYEVHYTRSDSEDIKISDLYVRREDAEKEIEIYKNAGFYRCAWISERCIYFR